MMPLRSPVLTMLAIIRPMHVPTRRLTKSLRVPGTGRLLFLLSMLAFLSVIASAQSSAGLSGTTAAEVRGTVVNAATGGPVPRALVKMDNQAVFTDAQGRFALNAPAGTQANLMLMKPGFYLNEDPGEGFNLAITPAQMTEPVVLRLYPEAILSGTLSSQEGEPLAHVNVMALRASLDESGHHWQPSGQTQTDVDGEFRLTVPPGDFRLQTTYVRSDPLTGKCVLPLIFPVDSTTGTRSSIHVRGGEEKHVDLTATLATAHNVTLPLEAQQTFASPINLVATQGDGPPIQVFVQSQPDHNFVRIQLPPGTYSLFLNRGTEEGPLYAEANVTVEDQDTTGPALHFAPAAAIPVEVNLAGGVASDNEIPTVQQLGAYLSGRTSSLYNSRFYAMTARDKSSQFSVAPGTYNLRAGQNGQWYIQSAFYGTTNLLTQEFVATAGPSAVPMRLTVSKSTGKLQGATTMDGRPCACWVYLISSVPSATPLSIFRTNQDGSFAALNLPPGTYRAIAFLHRQSADLSNAAVVTSLGGVTKSISLDPGATATLNLEAVGDSGAGPTERAK